MSDAFMREQVEAATGYDDFFVPALFEEWAGRVADAACVAPGERVLDVACGTGVLAREVKRRVGPAGSVAGLDVNSGMLAVAARREPGITWRQAPAEAIPYGDGSFDAVVSQFGLMFFSDQRAALREMWRVLARGGAMAVAVWDSLENAPAYASELDLVRRLAGEQAAGLLRAPFSLGDPDRLRDLFAQAGIPSATLTTITGRGRFPSVRAMIDADVISFLPLGGVVLSEERTAAILAEAERALRPYVLPDGTVEFAFPAHIVAATKE